MAVIERRKDAFVVMVEIPYKSSMLDAEEAIQAGLAKAGRAATIEALGRFDTDGSPIEVAGTRLYSKGKAPKEYQSLYGPAPVERHVYQSSRGGETHCPLESRARIIVTSTPLFAKIISHKYADMGAVRLLRDLKVSHGRTVARSFVQNVADAVGAVALAKEEEAKPEWTYSLPKLDPPVATVTIGVDGTCMLLCDDGWREAMVGTLGFYDNSGERLHTIYVGASPEYGKESFYARMAREIQQVKGQLPQARYVGLADGAESNWTFLEQQAPIQVLDFYHAAERLGKVAEALWPKHPEAKQNWRAHRCEDLKSEPGAAKAIIRELQRALEERELTTTAKETIEEAVTYFRNQSPRMNYPDQIAQNVPIGSGVTEAACKVIVKQRMCNSGMRWKDQGAKIVLTLRCLSHTHERWDQFWDKIDQYGYNFALSC